MGRAWKIENGWIRWETQRKAREGIQQENEELKQKVKEFFKTNFN